MTLSIVTTTTGRPFCFSLLEKWVARQTLQPDRWIVVGEDLKDYAFTQGQTVIKRKKKKKEKHSLIENWLAAFPLVENDTVLIMDDDDWYHPNYIETMVRHLESNDLVGVGSSIYYKMRCKKWRRMGNVEYSCLGATGLRGSKLSLLKRICQETDSHGLDCLLWDEAQQNGWNRGRIISNVTREGKPLHIGFKQMPGNPGIGVGHTDTGNADPNFAKLTEWIGHESRIYRGIRA